MTEAWRAIDGWPGYEVSSEGRVRRSAPAATRRVTGRPLSAAGLRNGYPSVDLCHDGLRRSVHVHRLVAAAFVGRCPDGHEVNHINGRKTDPRAVNLEYVTRAANQRHAYRVGLQDSRGSRNGHSKLTDDRVRAIRAFARTGELSQREIARRFGIGQTTVNNIVKRKRWAHVS